MEQANHSETLFIRITDEGIMLASEGSDGPWFEPQIVRKGISPAVNIRDILRKKPELTQDFKHVTVIIDSPVMLLPEEDFNSENLEKEYNALFKSDENISIEHITLNSLKAVVAYGVSKDFKTVLADNFEDVEIQPLMLKTWEYLNNRSQGKNPEKLYAYLHEGKMEVCAFVRNRFQFSNSFDIVDIHDALFFILGVWKNLGYDKARGELFLAGNHEEWEWLTSEARKFIPHTYHINPAADFNRAPVTCIEGLPFDLMLHFLF